jgi:predicted N-acyltransferase
MEFSFDMLMPQPLKKLILGVQERIPCFLRLKIAFLGSLTAEEFYLGLEERENLEVILDGALGKLRQFCQREGISGIAFNNLSLKNKRLIEYLRARHYIKMESLPTTSIRLKASSFEGYLASLSKNSRKDLKRKLKHSAAQVKLTTVIREEISDISEQIYNLYLNNFSDSSVHFETLTPEFFQRITANLPGVAKYFITYDRDRIVAFNLCLIKKGTCIDKFVGFDAVLCRRYHLYFTTFCYNIDWCLKNAITDYQPGISDYYPKIRLGARLTRLFIYSKGFNPLLNLTLKLVAKFIEPKNLDPSLKKIDWEKLSAEKLP